MTYTVTPIVHSDDSTKLMYDNGDYVHKRNGVNRIIKHHGYVWGYYLSIWDEGVRREHFFCSDAHVLRRVYNEHREINRCSETAT